MIFLASDIKLKGANYFNNVLKSMQYGATDLTKGAFPSIIDLVDANKDSSKAVIDF